MTDNSLSLLERIFFISTLALLPGFFMFLTRVIAIVEERTAEDDRRLAELEVAGTSEYELSLTHPRWSDLLLAVAVCGGMCLLRYVLSSTIFRMLGEMLVAKKEEREARVSRFGGVLFKFIYFIFICYYGFKVLSPEPWMPTVLGGTGHYRNAWIDYPKVNVNWAMKSYYLIELGYHMHALLYHVCSDRRNDFMEMLLHHFIAMFLVSLSYILNYLRPGSIILFLHDIADVFVYSCKMLVDTKYRYVTFSSYLGMLVAWGFARLYVLPFHVLHNVYFESFDLIHGAQFFFAMLVILQLLHIYWYLLFFKMGYHFLRKGETVDMHQKVSATEGSDPHRAPLNGHHTGASSSPSDTAAPRKRKPHSLTNGKTTNL